MPHRNNVDADGSSARHTLRQREIELDMHGLNSPTKLIGALERNPSFRFPISPQLIPVDELLTCAFSLLPPLVNRFIPQWIQAIYRNKSEF